MLNQTMMNLRLIAENSAGPDATRARLLAHSVDVGTSTGRWVLHPDWQKIMSASPILRGVQIPAGAIGPTAARSGTKPKSLTIGDLRIPLAEICSIARVEQNGALKNDGQEHRFVQMGDTFRQVSQVHEGEGTLICVEFISKGKFEIVLTDIDNIRMD